MSERKKILVVDDESQITRIQYSLVVLTLPL